jgi:hypothetical protein
LASWSDASAPRTISCQYRRLSSTTSKNGIEVVAIHNHMLQEQPRLFFVHFWANADELANGLEAALSKRAVAHS